MSAKNFSDAPCGQKNATHVAGRCWRGNLGQYQKT
jgi:hypothetical protein